MKNWRAIANQLNEELQLAYAKIEQQDMEIRQEKRAKTRFMDRVMYLEGILQNLEIKEPGAFKKFSHLVKRGLGY